MKKVFLKQHATSSYSMPKELHERLKAALPRHGARSKLVAKLIEDWLRQFSVAQNNT